MKVLTVLIIPLFFLAGCVGSAEVIIPSEEGLEVNYEHEERVLHSFQFWGEYPSSVGNTSFFNETGLLHCLINTFNHAEGDLLLVISNGNETLHSENYRNETAELYLSIPANTTMNSYKSGYHDPDVASIGDFFVVDCRYQY
jgi:hypothetical protein